MSSLSEDGLNLLKASINELSIENAKNAIDQLNYDGITVDNELPFLGSTYNQLPEELCKKLQGFGIPFLPKVIGTYLTKEGNVFAIYNPSIFNPDEAISWLKIWYKNFQ